MGLRGEMTQKSGVLFARKKKRTKPFYCKIQIKG